VFQAGDTMCNCIFSFIVCGQWRVETKGRLPRGLSLILATVRFSNPGDTTMDLRSRKCLSFAVFEIFSWLEGTNEKSALCV
jgi:hypothetical protein